MTRSLRLVPVTLAVLSLIALSGCDYFGTHDGYEDGELPLFGIQGMAAYEVVGVAPDTVGVGDEVTVFMASESDAPVNSFAIDDFWFCTSDGFDPMVETGGNNYNSDVDQDDLFARVETDLTEDELDGQVISTVTFTVPDGTQTGEGFVITPGNQNEYFDLTIQ